MWATLTAAGPTGECKLLLPAVCPRVVAVTRSQKPHPPARPRNLGAPPPPPLPPSAGCSPSAPEDRERCSCNPLWDYHVLAQPRCQLDYTRRLAVLERLAEERKKK